MKREGGWSGGRIGAWIVGGMMVLAATALGQVDWWTAAHYWDNRPDAPPTKLSDLGEVKMLNHVRVATLDGKLEARLSQARAKMRFASHFLQLGTKNEPIPATLVDAANFLVNHISMAYPPVLCVEADDAFFFSMVDDFEWGMAIMRADGSLWDWSGLESETDGTAVPEKAGEPPALTEERGGI